MKDDRNTDDSAPRRAVLWSYIAAALLAGLIFFDASLSGPEPDLILRALMAAGLMLYASDVLETATIATRERELWDRDLWVAGVLHGWFLGVVVLILLWDGVGSLPVTAIGAGLACVLYAVVTVVGPWRKKPSLATGLYDLDRPASKRKNGLLFWRIWPVLAIVLVIGMIIIPPKTNWDPAYILFQLIFLPFIVTYYPARNTLPVLLHPTTRRLSGIALLLTGLFLPG